MFSTGGRHTALLRSDGCAVAVGKMILDNATFATFHPWRECHTSRFRLAEVIHCFSEVMAMLWPADWTYLDLAPFPPWDEGVSYTQVSAGVDLTVLLRSDGRAIACGNNFFGQCNVPPLVARTVIHSGVCRLWLYASSLF